MPEVVAVAVSDPERCIDRYVIVERLGVGGMGEVHRGCDTLLGRWVALKLLHSVDQEAVERFLREAKLLARLNHPNVTQVFDAGVHNGRPWLAMELVERACAPEGQAARRRSAELVRDAARGVQHAHDAGIVHRDLKPSNLLASSSGRVYMSDFDLARALAEEGTTVTGELLGTPAFMAWRPSRPWGALRTRGPTYGGSATPSTAWSKGSRRLRVRASPRWSIGW